MSPGPRLCTRGAWAVYRCSRHVHGRVRPCIPVVNRAVYTVRGRVHGRLRLVYTAVSVNTHTGRKHGVDTACVPAVHGKFTCVHGKNKPCTWAVNNGRVQRPCCRVQRTCLWPVYTAVHDPNTAMYTAVYGPCTRAVKTAVYAVHGRVHRPFTAEYTACLQPVYTTAEYGPYTRPCSHSSGHGWTTYTARARLCTRFTAVYTIRTRP